MMELDSRQFGESVRTRRKAAGITQHQLADRAGVSVRAVRYWERGGVNAPRTASRHQVQLALDALTAIRPERRVTASVGLLGPLVVETPHPDGPPLRNRAAALLAVLALQPNLTISRDEIAYALWGDDPPASHVRLIHANVHAVRRALGPVSAPRLLAGPRGGYLLEAGPGQLDVLRFQALADQGAAAHLAGDLLQAYALYGASLRCWRGLLLAGFDELSHHHPAAAALGVRRGSVALQFADVASEVGLHAEVVAQLSPLAAEDPLHEGLHTRLLIALARTGQRAAALRLFDGIRGRLSRELGLSPGGELANAHLQLLRDTTP
jgi:DNA-binding SARP family transcriptional activator/DNA-binding XRE family transcriptional regulator